MPDNQSGIHLTMTFDAGHRIVGHKGKCARLHGHTYKVEIFMTGPIKPGPGFVVDFGDVKDLVNEWDHALLLWDQDPIVNFGLNSGDGIVRLNFNPTAEHMADYLSEEIGKRFDLDACTVTLWETPNACATSFWLRQ